MIKKTEVNITPDKSLIKKLGLTGYKTEQAIAELIDNSIDARIDGKTEHIEVRLDFEKKQILVTDNGNGMNLEELRNALTIAKETKKEGEKLGQFGLGMKSACSNLGKSFTLTATRPNSNLEYTARYDEDQWLSDSSKNWTNFEIEESKREHNWHGIIIRISKLKVPLYPNQILNFKKSFGIRYGPYLKKGQIRITINSRECKSITPQLEPGTKHKINIALPSGNMLIGWVGLLEKRSIKGDYGIHLIRKKRLIKAFDKFGIRQHPEVAKIVGEISLDHVPVNFHKTGFLEDSLEYKESEIYFKNDPTVVKTLRSSSSQKISSSKITDVLDYQYGTIPDKPIDTRISAANAKSLLRKTKQLTIQKSPHELEMMFEDGDFGLYTLDKYEKGLKITVNRDSEAFKSFKNPLFLLGLIKIESELFLKYPSNLSKFLEERNNLWADFVSKFLPQPELGKTKQEKTVPLPNYSLVPDLIDLHDHIKENFEHDYQFTGLSTLNPFLHNAYNKTIYNIQTINGAGQELLERITNFIDVFTVWLNPNDVELETILKLPGNVKIIIIREYSDKLSSTWATPEKAWLDLYFEVEKHNLTLYKDELIIILDDLLESNLVDKTKLRSLARRRKLYDEIETYLGSE